MNTQIPAYSQIAEHELREESFAKTPKGSIKRFMYSRQDLTGKQIDRWVTQK